MNRRELRAAWYLRFNCYFTVQDFTLHGDSKATGTRTDADILGVQFPHSFEEQRRFTFERDDALIEAGVIDFAICEVKSNESCTIKCPWLNPESENVEYALRWMGFSNDEKVRRDCALQVYKTGKSIVEGQGMQVRFVCFGNAKSDALSKRLPGALQIEHKRVVTRLQVRFRKNCYGITRTHWDPDIQEFAKLCKEKSVDDLFTWARGT